MERRDFLNGMALSAALAGLNTVLAEGDSAAPHAVVAQCVHLAGVCVEHCITLLGNGEKNMTKCLQTARDCALICQTAITLKDWKSAEASTAAKMAVSAAKACLEACKPHVGHHAECKACAQSCEAAIPHLMKWAS